MFQHLSFWSRELGRGILQILYPGACFACGGLVPAGQGHFCPLCRAALTTDPYPACPRCGRTVGPFAQVEKGCSRCRGANFHFQGVLRLGPYEGLLRQMILRIKYMTGEGLAEALGDLWAKHGGSRLKGIEADVIIPVPLYWWRRWRRGYNVSEALAHALAAILQVPCQPGWLRRIRNTPQQTGQTPANRRSNLRGAFRPGHGVNVRGRTVLLVDDVLTTGSTCDEAAKSLIQAGASSVVVAVLAGSSG